MASDVIEEEVDQEKLLEESFGRTPNERDARGILRVMDQVLDDQHNQSSERSLTHYD